MICLISFADKLRIVIGAAAGIQHLRDQIVDSFALTCSEQEEDDIDRYLWLVRKCNPIVRAVPRQPFFKAMIAGGVRSILCGFQRSQRNEYLGLLGIVGLIVAVLGVVGLIKF